MIWSSCFYGNDSQRKAILQEHLLASYLAITAEDRDVMALEARRSQEGAASIDAALDAAFADPRRQGILDRGYPDASIRASSRENLRDLQQQQAQQLAFVKALS